MCLVSQISRRLEELDKAARIPCPHCGAEFVDEEMEHVTYHGGEKIEVCGECRHEFMVVEDVRRAYATRREST